MLNLTIIDYNPIPQTGLHIPGVHTFTCRYVWLIPFETATYTNAVSSVSPQQTAYFACFDREQEWDEVDIEDNAGRVIVPKLKVAMLKSKTRCDQYYQHISSAVNDKATYWHKFNGRYVESDPSCYDKDTGEIISPLCYNVAEAVAAKALDILADKD